MSDTDDLLAGLEWQEKALCAQTDPEAFFPEKGGSSAAAKRVCAECTVVDECLEYALAHDERFGVYGGKSERERRLIAKSRKLASAAAEAPEPVEIVPGLTERQSQVFHLRADGLSNVQIADDLCVSTKTVETHLKAIRAAGVIPGEIPAATEDRPDMTWEDCGTEKAISRHKRQQVPACQACLAKKRALSAAERVARKADAA